MFNNKVLTVQTTSCVEVMPLGTKALYWKTQQNSKLARLSLPVVTMVLTELSVFLFLVKGLI